MRDLLMRRGVTLAGGAMQRLRGLGQVLPLAGDEGQYSTVRGMALRAGCTVCDLSARLECLAWASWGSCCCPT